MHGTHCGPELSQQQRPPKKRPLTSPCVLSLVAILPLIGCRGDTDVASPPADLPAVSVDVSPGIDTLAVIGRTVQLTATPRDASGGALTGLAITWSSSSPAAASVDSVGLVTARGPGSALIRAAVEGASGSARVAVVPVVAEITISLDSATLFIGAVRHLAARVADSAGNVFRGPRVTWSSLDPAVAAVSAAGIVRGGAVGSTQVTATSEGRSDTTELSVTLRSYVSLSAGAFHTCGLTAGGIVECWGFGGSGQLGNDSTGDRPLPVEVQSAEVFSFLIAGALHTCGIAAGGIASCWGHNNGRLGTGSATGPEQCIGPCSRTPTAVTGPLRFATLTAGFTFSCGGELAGATYCWGTDGVGQLGNGDTATSASPVSVSGISTFVTVSAGADHACALTADGAARCWGRNDAGQLGTGSATGPELCADIRCSTSPVAVAGGLTFAAIAAGYEHTCGLTATGAAYCWGSNASGQLGIGNTPSAAVPTPVAGSVRFMSISAGASHTCAIATDGTPFCWGANGFGQLGLGTDTGPAQCDGGPCAPTPLPVTGGTRLAAITTGSSHTCGVAGDGTPYCWGENANGQLGDGTAVRRTTPVAVFGSQ